MLDLLKGEPDVLAVDNDLEEGGQDIIAISEILERLVIELTAEEWLQAVRSLKERSSIGGPIVTQLMHGIEV